MLVCQKEEKVLVICCFGFQNLADEIQISVNSKLPKNGCQVPFISPRGSGELTRDMAIVAAKSHLNSEYYKRILHTFEWRYYSGLRVT